MTKIEYPAGQVVEFFDVETGGLAIQIRPNPRPGPDWYDADLCHGKMFSVVWLWNGQVNVDPLIDMLIAVKG